MISGAFHKVNNVFDRVYMTVAGVLFIILICASFVQVVTRYVFNASLTGTEELARYCYIWMSLLGGSIAVGKWAHTSITVLYDLLPKVPKKLMFCFHNICVILLALIFIFGGIKMMQVSGNQTTPSLHLPKSIIYLAVPVTGVGMILHAFEHISYTLENLTKDDNEQLDPVGEEGSV